MTTSPVITAPPASTRSSRSTRPVVAIRRDSNFVSSTVHLEETARSERVRWPWTAELQLKVALGELVPAPIHRVEKRWLRLAPHEVVLAEEDGFPAGATCGRVDRVRPQLVGDTGARARMRARTLLGSRELEATP